MNLKSRAVVGNSLTKKTTKLNPQGKKTTKSHKKQHKETQGVSATRGQLENTTLTS